MYFAPSVLHTLHTMQDHGLNYLMNHANFSIYSNYTRITSSSTNILYSSYQVELRACYKNSFKFFWCWLFSFPNAKTNVY